MQTHLPSPAPDRAAFPGQQPAEAGLQLPAVLDMRAVRALKSSLELLYAKGAHCVIDGQDVERLSTGCIQIMAAFFGSMASAKHTVTLRNPSAALLDGFDQLGLSSFLDHCVLES